MKFLRGGNLRECSEFESGVRLLDFLEENSVVDGLVEFFWSNGFGGRYHFLCFQVEFLCIESWSCSVFNKASGS